MKMSLWPSSGPSERSSSARVSSAQSPGCCRPRRQQRCARIAALHARASRAEDTDWTEIDLLYGTLERMQPSPIVSLNHAIAVAKLRGPSDALAMIEPLASKLGGYFYFHGARGAFLLNLGRTDEARVAFDRAIALANTPAEAAHIREQLDRLAAGAGPGCASSKAEKRA